VKRFCSQACAKPARIEKACLICNAAMLVPPNAVSRIVTCSKACGSEYRTRRQTGRPVTWGEKISAATKGKSKGVAHITPEYREKQRVAALARNFGQINKGRTLPEETRAKMSAAHMGQNTGKTWKLSEEHAQARYERAKKGSESHLWKGGITPINAAIRSSAQYKAWRRAVLKRDNKTCVMCGAHGVPLHADHIKSFAYHHELRFDVSNGRTLCVPCHKATPTYLNGAKAIGRKEAA
jgi:broad specificity phosphatase PhoE